MTCSILSAIIAAVVAKKNIRKLRLNSEAKARGLGAGTCGARELEFKGRLPKYILAGFCSIMLNVIVLKLIVSSTGFDPFYVQVGLIPFIVLFNFSTAKFWSLQPSAKL